MLRDVIFADQGRLNSYLGQMDGMRQSHSLKVAMGLPFGAGVEWSQSSTEQSRPAEARIDSLLTFLRDTEQLRADRPGRIDWSRDAAEPVMVYETVSAIRVLMPMPEWMPGGPRALTVWVADPDIKQEYLSPSNHNFQPIFDVSFLYLIQEHWPDSPAESMISGCSALQMVANLAAQKPPTEPDSPGWPPVDLGRFDQRHPVAKLAEMGGMILGSRRIETLYLVRYMTNEQSFCYLRDMQNMSEPLEWSWLRVHDLVAYPIFICGLGQ